MKSLGFAFLTVLFLVSNAFAEYGEDGQPWATVSKLGGEVSLNGKKLKANADIYEGGGLLVTKAKSFVKIHVPAWGSDVSLGPNSSMELDFKKSDSANYTLKKGLCRWISEKGGRHEGNQVRTKTAAMGIRGTDFVVQYSPSGETDIVVLDGKVLFGSALAKGSEKLVNSGQWGGVGGKYGKTVSDVVDLPPAELKKWAAKIE